MQVKINEIITIALKSVERAGPKSQLRELTKKTLTQQKTQTNKQLDGIIPESKVI